MIETPKQFISRAEAITPIGDAALQTADAPSCWAIGFFIFAAWLLLSNSASVALFEPDEGRNAEIAREILLLRDWVTPHYDFIPRLDKPMLFFDLVAVSYKLFGVSEWSARLPSALAALGCLSLIYLFSQALFGRWTALWSSLILLTSTEFFALSRIVILDMLLTFFLTGALCCFFLAQREHQRSRAKVKFVLMYVLMGAATLVKGPIGLLLPAVIVGCYLFLTKQWRLLGCMELSVGIPVFILTVAPWYLLVEYRHPGYLEHFFVVENVARFTTSQFNRSGSWLYFVAVLSVGFLPWTGLLPHTVGDIWRRSMNTELRFLVAWIVIPLLFFSVSASKLPHYILPVYPPLAIIVGLAIAKRLTDPSIRARRVSVLAPAFFLLVSTVFFFAVLWPQVLPAWLQGYLQTTFPAIPVHLIAGVVLALTLAVIACSRRLWEKPAFGFAATCVAFALFVLYVHPILASVSLYRSSKQLAEKAVSFIHDDQIVLFGGYPSSLPFYLKIQRPIWVVWSGKSSKVLGSDYVATNRPEPAAGYGQVLFTYDEFASVWKTRNGRLVVFVDDGAMARFNDLVGGQPRIIMRLGGTFVVENRPAVY
jgi:hypothetical protein